MTLLKHKPSKTTQSVVAIALQQQQTGLHTTKPALYATLSHCKQPGGMHWWNLRCSFTQKAFMGLYSIPERDKLLAIFKGHTARIAARDFWAVAEQVLTLSNAHWQGVTA